MGTYVNPANEVLLADMRQDIYIDKSMIMTELNKIFGSSLSRVCVSRPRRFGKTMVGNLVSAYYTRGADSRPIFEKLELSHTDNWDEWLNKCNVIKIDMNDFWNDAPTAYEVIPNLTKYVMAELKEEFPGMLTIEETLPKAIQAIYQKTKVPFVVIIDEYDVLIRERVPRSAFEEYLKLLSGLFKSGGASQAIKLAYITGIIPIVRDRVQSKLNNFKEYTMLTPRDLAPFIGFTLDEVKALCEKHGMDYGECLRWYDGYKIAKDVSICNSNSVCEAIANHQFDDYWTQTGAYTAISDYIDGNYDGIREDIATMVGGGSVYVDAASFMNTLDAIESKDDVFTYLIHLGYLAYDQESKTCHIPNGEIHMEWERALKRTVNFKSIVEIIENSRRLLEATIAGDSDAVASTMDKSHLYVTTPFTYDNEGSLQSAIGLAYIFARTQYTLHSEFHSGKGYADMALIPYVPGKPYIVIELKVNEKPKQGLKQIIANGYADDFRSVREPVILVAISYDKQTKKHTCEIEVCRDLETEK